MRQCNLFCGVSACGGLVVVAVFDSGVGAGDELGVLDDAVAGVEAAAVGDQDGGAAFDAELAGFGGGRGPCGEPVFAPRGLVAGYLVGQVPGVEQGGEAGGVPGGEEGGGGA